MSTLAEWLTQIGAAHPCDIELGLTRVHAVAARLNVLEPSSAVIVVGGTNGKGSTVAALEAIYRASGYQTGVFTSPILFRHNEQVRINGKEVNDEAFCTAFAKIEAVRGEISLTPFEYHTLAAFLIMQSQPLDVWILEVGMGGRLDAVNILDADLAIVTSVGLDHMQWLGDTREKIGYEKAGIFRPGKPAVCGDPSPPRTLIDTAKQMGALLYCQGKDFYYENLSSLRGAKRRSNPDQNNVWIWVAGEIELMNLPKPTLHLQNMSTALMGIALLQNRLPVTRAAIEQGLKSVNLPGRIEIIPGEVIHIYDVAHNPDAIQWLAARLKELSYPGKTIAVFSMLADKDILASIKNISADIDIWFVAPLQTKRAASMQQLRDLFQQAGIEEVKFLPSISEAYQKAKSEAKAGDCIVVFGSFHTIAEARLFYK